MNRTSTILLLSFLSSGMVGLSGCGSETPEAGPAASPATTTVATNEATPKETKPAAKPKAKKGPEVLPLNGEPKLLLSEDEIRDGWIQLFDGQTFADWEDTRSADPNPRRGSKVEAGPISLQGHDPTTDLSFRNLRVAAYPTAE